MNYDMKKPCDNCPFRRKGGIRLHPDRVKEISTHDGEFPCHKTTVDDGDGDLVEHEGSLHCAGFLIFRELTRTPGQMMRICERIGIYDPRKLLRNNPAVSEVFGSLREFKRAGREI